MTQHSVLYSKVRNLYAECCPIVAAIEVTNRCNARCSYCFIEDHITKRELTTLQFRAAIDKLAQAGIFYVNITGGEPFLRSDITEILLHVFSSGFFATSIYTNGTLLTTSHIDFLSTHKAMIHPVRMTVFSHHEAIHDRYMQVPGSLATIIAHGLELKKNGVDVQLAVPLMDFNNKELSDTFSYFLDLGFPIGLNHMKLLTTKNIANIGDMTTIPFYLDAFSDNTSFIKNNVSPPASECVPDSNILCRGIQETIMIDIDGNIHPCTAFRNFIIGSIFDDQPLSAILKRSEDYRALKQLNTNDLKCKSCEFSGECTPCLAFGHNLTGNTKDIHPQRCNIYAAIAQHNSPSASGV